MTTKINSKTTTESIEQQQKHQEQPRQPQTIYNIDN
jgi:hypothetical protein